MKASLLAAASSHHTRTSRTAAVACIFLASLLYASAVFAGSVSGTVKNGTTGQLASGVDVILIQLQGGMQPVSTAKTDAQGRYHFDNPQLGSAPMLIRVVYRGVNYHEPIPPGKTTADVEVFEPTDKPGSFSVPNHAIIVQPSGADLIVGEEYIISNKTTPPVAFYRADGSFNFNLPVSATFDQASAWGTSGMPVVQTTIDKGKNAMAVAFPFRPGESGVRISYRVPYQGNQATLRNISAYNSSRLIIAAPPTVQISGPGIASAGQDQGMAIYTRENVAANQPVDILISGTAPVAPQSAQAPPDGAPATGSVQDPSVNSRADSGGGGTDTPTATATAIPARLDSVKWILVAGFAAIFALGCFYLMRQSPVTAPSAPTPAFSGSIPSIAPVAAAPALSAIESEVRGGVEDLKNSLFRLELRRQAGTIADEDYARERARIEIVLRELVKG